MSFKIGNIEIKNNIVLAPMAGISNPSYIRICEEMGVGLAVTELLSAEAIIRNNKKTLEMLNGIEKINIPVAVQIFGSNEQSMQQAAKILTETYNIKIIDINMGCPVPKVAIRSNSGAALLKDKEKVAKIVQAVKQQVSCPVTVKIRSGWDENNINAVEIAKACEKAGASAITIHGRTRKQLYSGKVDLDIIKKVKKAVNIPVIGNGDIVDIPSFTKMLDYTKCDAVMIGRGLLGNPWLIEQILTYEEKGIITKETTYIDKINMALKHLDYLLEIKNDKTATLEMRSHISWYLTGLKDSTSIKIDINKAKNSEELKKILNNYLNYLKNSIK